MLLSRMNLTDGHSWLPFFLWGAAGSLTRDVQDRQWTSSVQPLKKSGFVELLPPTTHPGGRPRGLILRLGNLPSLSH